MRTFIGTFIVFIISTTHGFAELVTKEVLLRDIAGKRFQFSTPAGATGFIEYTKRGAMYISGSNFDPRRDRGI